MKETSWKDLLSLELFFILFGLFSFLFVILNLVIYAVTDGEKYTGKIDKIEKYIGVNSLGSQSYCIVKFNNVIISNITPEKCFSLELNKTYNIEYKKFLLEMNIKKIEELK